MTKFKTQREDEIWSSCMGGVHPDSGLWSPNKELEAGLDEAVRRLALCEGGTTALERVNDCQRKTLEFQRAEIRRLRGLLDGESHG